MVNKTRNKIIIYGIVGLYQYNSETIDCWLRVLSNRSSISLTKWTVVVVAQHAEEINE